MGKGSRRYRPSNKQAQAQAQVDGKQQQQPKEPEVTNFELSKAGRQIHEIWVQNACRGEDVHNREMAIMIGKKMIEDGVGPDPNKNRFTEGERIRKVHFEYQEKLKHEMSRELAIMHRDILLDMASKVQKGLDENPIEKVKADEARRMEAEIAAEIQRQASLVQPSLSVVAQDAASSEVIENVASAETPVLVEEEETVDSDEEEDEEEKPDCNCMARNLASELSHITNPLYSCYKCNSSDADIDPRTYADVENVEIQRQASLQQQQAAIAETETIREVESTCAVQPVEELSVAEQLKRCSIAMNEAIEDMAKATNLDDF